MSLQTAEIELACWFASTLKIPFEYIRTTSGLYCGLKKLDGAREL